MIRFLPLLLAFAVLPVVFAQTRLEEASSRLDSLRANRERVESRLSRLDASIRSGQAELGSIEERLQQLGILLAQLEEEGKLLRLQVEAGILEVQDSEGKLLELGTELDSLEARKAALNLETEALVRQLFPLRHLDRLSPLLQHASLRNSARATRLAAMLGQPLQRTFTELDSLRETMATTRRMEQQLGDRRTERLQQLRRSQSRLEANRAESSRREGELARDRVKKRELLLAEGRDKEIAREEVERLQQAGQLVASELDDLRQRWALLETQREEEARRMDDLNQRMGAETHSAASPPPESPVPLGAAPERGAMLRPVDGQIVGAFGLRRDAATGAQLEHPGVEFSCSPGATIRAAAGGVVERITWISGFGSTVLLRHGDETWTVYARLDNVQVREGQSLGAGEPVGSAGRAEQGAGGALHFEVWRGNKAQDPATWLRK